MGSTLKFQSLTRLLPTNPWQDGQSPNRGCPPTTISIQPFVRGAEGKHSQPLWVCPAALEPHFLFHDSYSGQTGHRGPTIQKALNMDLNAFTRGSLSVQLPWRTELATCFFHPYLPNLTRKKTFLPSDSGQETGFGLSPFSQPE